MISSLNTVKSISNNKFKIKNTIIVKDIYLIIDQFNLSKDILNVIINYLGRNSYKKYYKEYVLSQILIIKNTLYTKIGTYKNILCSFCILYGNEIRLNLFSNIGYIYTHPLCWNCEFNCCTFTKIYYIYKIELNIIKYKNLYNLIMNEFRSKFNNKNINYSKKNNIYTKNYFIN